MIYLGPKESTDLFKNSNDMMDVLIPIGTTVDIRRTDGLEILHFFNYHFLIICILALFRTRARSGRVADEPANAQRHRRVARERRHQRQRDRHRRNIRRQPRSQREVRRRPRQQRRAASE